MTIDTSIADCPLSSPALFFLLGHTIASDLMIILQHHVIYKIIIGDILSMFNFQIKKRIHPPSANRCSQATSKAGPRADRHNYNRIEGFVGDFLRRAHDHDHGRSDDEP